MSHTEGAESRVSRRVTQERKKRNLISKLVIVLLGLFICVATAVGIPSDSAQFNTQAVQAIVQQLYLDEQQDYLNPEVTGTLIEKTVEEVEALVGNEADSFYLKAREAQTKYQAIESLKDIYETEAPVIKGDHVQTDLKLHEDVTLGSIQEIIERHPLPSEDDLSTQINHLYNEAIHVLEDVAAVEDLLEGLPKEMSDEVDLHVLLPQLVEVEIELERLEGQPSVDIMQVEFEKLATELADELKTQAETIDFDEKLLAQMFECDALSKHLRGSILDSRKLVSLTFDDGPNPLYTQQVLDILAKYDVKATFFLLGQEVVRHPQLAKKIVDAGHVVANHSFGHPNLADISDEEVMEEINQTQAAIFEATGVTATMYRMPYGAGGARVVNMFPELESVIWNVDSEDWVSDDAYLIYDNVIENMLPHTVILMHDKHQSTVDSLELIIPELLDQGYEFVDPLEVGMEFLYYE